VASRIALIVFTLLTAGALISMTSLLGGLARRVPGVLLAAFSLVILLTPRSGQLSLGHVGPRQILGVDPVLLVAIGAAARGLPNLARRLGGLRMRCAFILVMVVTQTALGYLIYRNQALLEVRPLLVLIGLIMFLLSLDEGHDLEQLARSWLYWTAGALCLLALERAATSGIGNANLRIVTSTGDLITSRVANASQVAVVAAAGLLSLYENARRSSLPTVLRTVAFFAVVLVAQHRSVWVATTAGVIVLAGRSVRPQQLTRVVGQFTLLCVLLSPVLVVSGAAAKVGASVSESLASVSTTTGTGGARVSSTGQLITRARARGPLIELFGGNYGTPVERIEGGRLVTYQPHDAYVQAFLNSGLVGLGLFLAVLLSLLRGAWRQRGGGLAIITLFLVYSFAYSFPYELAPALAALFSRTVQATETPTAVASETRKGAARRRATLRACQRTREGLPSVRGRAKVLADGQLSSPLVPAKVPTSHSGVSAGN